MTRNMGALTPVLLPLAVTGGMHDGDIGAGWLIVMVPLMVLMMGGMIWMMMRGMGGGLSPSSSAPSERRATTESAVEVLERRFAEGEISIEEYHGRREALAGETAMPNTKPDDQPVHAAAARDGGP